MPLRLAIRPDARRSTTDNDVEIPPHCAHHFRVLQEMIAHHEDDGEVCLEVPRCREVTAHHLVALVQLLEGSKHDELKNYVTLSVLNNNGIAADIELVELMQAADFVGCDELTTRLGQYLIQMIRSCSEDQLTGVQRPLTTIEKLEVLGEMPLIHQFSGR